MKRGTREEWKAFYDLFGPTVVDRLAAMDARAADIAALLESGATKERADIQRWVSERLDACFLFQEPPPLNLVRLNRLLIGVSEKPRATVKNRGKWRAAAAYKARNPEASASQIRKAIGYDQLTQIKKWLGSPEFKKKVEQERLISKYTKKIRRVAKKVLLPPSERCVSRCSKSFHRGELCKIRMLRLFANTNAAKLLV